MIDHAAIRLLVDDRAVLSALRFALTIEGFKIAGEAEATALVIDERYLGDGLAALEALRKQGCTEPAIVVATHPTPRFRARAASLNAELVEKPLLGDELSLAIRAATALRKAA